jgi:hypothetical protein
VLIMTAQSPVWQPIATAPKDGTRLLLLKPNREVEIGRYHSADDINGRMHGGMWRYRRSMSPRYDHANQPTHWTPLPAPPVIGSGTDADAKRADSPRRSAAPDIYFESK